MNAVLHSVQRKAGRIYQRNLHFGQGLPVSLSVNRVNFSEAILDGRLRFKASANSLKWLARPWGLPYPGESGGEVCESLPRSRPMGHFGKELGVTASVLVF